MTNDNNDKAPNEKSDRDIENDWGKNNQFFLGAKGTPKKGLFEKLVSKLSTEKDHPETVSASKVSQPDQTATSPPQPEQNAQDTGNDKEKIGEQYQKAVIAIESLRSSKEEFEKFREEYDNLKIEYDTLKGQLEKVRSINSGNEARLSDSGSRISDLEKRLGILSRQYEGERTLASEKEKKYIEEIDQLKMEGLVLKRDLSVSKSDHAKITNDNKRLWEEVNQYKTNFDELCRKLDGYNK